MIGQGAYGKVFEGMDLSTGKRLAIKKIYVSKNGKEKKARKDLETLMEEVKVLELLKHPKIV